MKTRLFVVTVLAMPAFGARHTDATPESLAPAVVKSGKPDNPKRSEAKNTHDRTLILNIAARRPALSLGCGYFKDVAWEHGATINALGTKGVSDAEIKTYVDDYLDEPCDNRNACENSLQKPMEDMLKSFRDRDISSESGRAEIDARIAAVKAIAQARRLVCRIGQANALAPSNEFLKNPEAVVDHDAQVVEHEAKQEPILKKLFPTKPSAKAPVVAAPDKLSSKTPDRAAVSGHALAPKGAGLDARPARPVKDAHVIQVAFEADRCKAGVMTFGDAESGYQKCYVMGIGQRTWSPTHGYTRGETRDGRSCWFKPYTREKGATPPGLYNLTDRDAESKWGKYDPLRMVSVDADRHGRDRYGRDGILLHSSGRSEFVKGMRENASIENYSTYGCVLAKPTCQKALLDYIEANGGPTKFKMNVVERESVSDENF